MADEQYIYTMYKMSKSFADKRILEDINLQFFPGAKIGLLGNNGAGKSTVLRIMACLLYTSPSPRDRTRSRMPSSA